MGFNLKSLLPIAGAAAGFFLGGPAGSAAMNAALGSGIGTLLGGGDLEDAVKNSILAGGAGMGLGALGVQGAGAAAAQSATGVAATEAATQAAAQKAAEATAAQAATQTASTEAAKQGIFGSGITGGDIYLGSSLLSLLEEPEDVTGGESNPESRPDYKGTPIAGLFVDPTTGVAYDTIEELEQAVGDRQQTATMAAGGIVSLNGGGYVEGPGTGTSDSIKAGIYQNGKKVQEARLSDGEFVFKEKSVVGAGNGNRELGAKRLYAMMDKFERMA